MVIWNGCIESDKAKRVIIDNGLDKFTPIVDEAILPVKFGELKFTFIMVPGD